MSDNFYCRPNVSLNKRETQLSKSAHVGRKRTFPDGIRPAIQSRHARTPLGHSRGQFDGARSTAPHRGRRVNRAGPIAGPKRFYWPVSRSHDRRSTGTEKFETETARVSKRMKFGERYRAVTDERKKDHDDRPTADVTGGRELDFPQQLVAEIRRRRMDDVTRRRHISRRISRSD